MSDSAPPSVVPGPLAGVRVLELGAFIAGPFAGRQLADMGADVIKVESPRRPDAMRDWGMTVDGRGLWWPQMARGKRLVTLDLRADEGRELALQLVEHCDVVLENFRPGTLESWGLGYDALRARNAGVILVRVSGYGQDGPYPAASGSRRRPRRTVGCGI